VGVGVHEARDEDLVREGGHHQRCDLGDVEALRTQSPEVGDGEGVNELHAHHPFGGAVVVDFGDVDARVGLEVFSRKLGIARLDAKVCFLHEHLTHGVAGPVHG